MNEIKLSRTDIAKIIAEKYNADPVNEVVVLAESKIQNYNSLEARRVYEPVAYVWKGEE